MVANFDALAIALLMSIPGSVSARRSRRTGGFTRCIDFEQKAAKNAKSAKKVKRIPVLYSFVIFASFCSSLMVFINAGLAYFS